MNCFWTTIAGRDLRTSGSRREEGIAVIEAPRGSLIHHYRVSEMIRSPSVT